jgi:hypothetical protein
MIGTEYQLKYLIKADKIYKKDFGN